MAEVAVPIPTPIAPSLPSRQDQTFPTLTPAQVARVAAHGSVRPIRAGEVLFEAGDSAVPFFVVTAGRLEIVRPCGDEETLVAVHGPGQFTGETNMITGRRALVRVRAAEPGEVVELDRERLVALVQTDGELGEIFMRAFLLRRAELIAHGIGDVLVVGSSFCPSTLRVREFLNRNGHPYAYIDLDQEDDVQELLDRFEVGEDDVPVLICRGDLVLRNPANQEIADCLGFNEAIDREHVRDLVVVGAGPAGLAAAVYAASEGLDVLVLESDSPGGQAGSSSKIENYLGFPTGISGQELTARATTQAQKFGAHNPAITLHARTELVALDGDGHLERVRWRDQAGEDVREVRHLFVMTGAVPSTRWLDGCVALDANGFVKTGPALTPEDLAAAGWPLARPPHLLETSRPGVFAVGDVRCGNVKRVASAVGEGSIAVAFVHQALRE